MKHYGSWAALGIILSCAACSIEGPVPEERFGDPSVDPGGEGGSANVPDPMDDEGDDDRGVGGADPGGSGSSGGAGGSAAPPETDHTNQVCYPGANDDFTACFPVVLRDASFPSAYDYPPSSDAAYQAPLRFLDLNALPASTSLAPNFTVGEVMQPSKGRYGIFQPHVIAKLQSMRNETGGALVVHSGFRSPGYNAGIPNSATFSRHMYGDGVDMHSAVVSLNTMRSLCQARGADYVKVYTTHVHCDWRYAPAEPAFYGAAQLTSTPSPAVDEAVEIVDEHGLWSVAVDGFEEGTPYLEWTAYDRDGRRLETVAVAQYAPSAEAMTVDVMVGGRLALRAQTRNPSDWARLPDEEVQFRLDTLAIPDDGVHHEH